MPRAKAVLSVKSLKLWMPATTRFTPSPNQRWKLYDEDWRNRERGDEYAFAVHKMIQQTLVRKSPWVLVENENKRYGWIKVLKTLCNALEKALEEQ